MVSPTVCGVSCSDWSASIFSINLVAFWNLVASFPTVIATAIQWWLMFLINHAHVQEHFPLLANWTVYGSGVHYQWMILRESHYKITKRTLEPWNQGTEFLWGIFKSVGDRVNLGVLGGSDSLSGGKKRREPCLWVKARGRQWHEACPSPKPATTMWLSPCK